VENEYYLPPEINVVLKTCYQDKQIPSNLRLLLHKHVPTDVVANESTDKLSSPKTDKQINPRTEWLRNIAAHYKADQELVKAARYRWQSYIDASDAKYVSMTIDWRMVIGLGGNSVFETDMTLHPLYGLPIIPGSALKGLTRTWVATEKNDTTQVSGPGGKSMLLVERILGNQPKGEFQHTGSVIFFDAILMNEIFRLTLDIMNPHYSDYYAKKDTPPSNDQKPIPVPFLTVSQATFLFAVALRNPLNKEHEGDDSQALQWLQEALVDYGIGSKTSAGYGYMKEKKQYKRPEALPVFQVGQDIPGKCLHTKNRDDIQVRVPIVASQVLQYNSFTPNDGNYSGRLKSGKTG
jgi:CRISPR-associated protein Cmr6